MPVLGQFPTEIHLVDSATVTWSAGAPYQDPNFPDFEIRDVTASTVAPTNPYDVICYLEQLPTASELVLAFKVTRAINFAANFTGSQGRLTANPTSTAVYNVNKNGASIGTISISTLGVFTFATSGGLAQSFAIGDELSIVAPNPADATLSGVGITLAGTR